MKYVNLWCSRCCCFSTEFKKLRRQLQGKRHIKIELCVKLRLLRLFLVDHVGQNRRSALSLAWHEWFSFRGKEWKNYCRELPCCTCGTHFRTWGKNSKSWTLCIYFNGAPCVPAVAYFCDIGEFEEGQRVKYRVEHEKKLNSMSQNNRYFLCYISTLLKKSSCTFQKVNAPPFTHGAK